MLEVRKKKPTMLELNQDIITLRKAKEAARSRYLACEQADRDNPYHDMRRASRATELALWQAVDAIATYRQARIELQAWHMTMQVVCVLYQERQQAA